MEFGDILRDVEVFRAGTHVASNGATVTTTTEDLDRIVAAYDPQYHEAPIVVGHPADNAPAWGWVRALKRIGDRLVATLDVVPEFAEMLRKGIYKKRSVSLYADLDGRGPYVRHVGFLGAAPPAVKGLADISLTDGAGKELTYEFDEKEERMSWKDRVKNLFTQAVDEIPEPSAQGGGGNPARGPLSYSEDEVRIFVQRAEAKAAEKARAEEREKATAEFAERTKKAEAEASRRERAGRIKARIDAMVSSGKVLPAWVKGGVVEFAASLPTGDSGVIEFGEAGSTTKIAPADWFLNFLEALPRSVHTEETATRANDPGRGTAPGAAATALGGLIRKKMDEKKGMGYAIAFSEVQRENPDLAQAYIEELRG